MNNEKPRESSSFVKKVVGGGAVAASLLMAYFASQLSKIQEQGRLIEKPVEAEKRIEAQARENMEKTLALARQVGDVVQAVNMLRLLGRLDEALREAEKLVRDEKEELHLLYLLGDIYRQKGDFQKAITSLKDAARREHIKLQPGAPWGDLATLYEKVGKPAHAKRCRAIDNAIRLEGPEAKAEKNIFNSEERKQKVEEEAKKILAEKD